MSRFAHVVIIAILGLGLAGCNAISSVVAPPPVMVAPVSSVPAGPAPITGILASPLGEALNSGDRRKAFDAEQQALVTGNKQSWRGSDGTFGYVSLLPDPVTNEGCRSYKETLFIHGRAKSGIGKGCRQADGSWQILS